jgi:hypothetical protein
MTITQNEHPYSASRLREHLKRRYPDHYALFVDLFSAGCLLHLQGERRAGSQLIAQVLDAAREPAEANAWSPLLKHLAGNELRFVRDIEPSFELGELCDKAQPIRDSEAACAR